MEFITENWIFQNVMPWIGIWFTAMTVIFFLRLIYAYSKEKFRSRISFYGTSRTFELSVIISLIPVLIAFLLIEFMDFLIKKKKSR